MSKKKEAKCIGIYKTTQKQCDRPAKYGKYCGLHNPFRKIKVKKTKEECENAIKKLRGRLEMRYDISFKELDEQKVERKVDLADTNKVLTNIVERFVRYIFNNDPEKFSYMRNDKNAIQFTRKVWHMISSKLNTRDVLAIAMTCRKMYKLVISDKVWHYTHPLKNIILNPRIFYMPVYRIMRLPAYQNLDAILSKIGRPTIEQLVDIYIEENKDTITKKMLLQTTGILIEDSMTYLLTETMKDELDDLVEAAPGSGFYEDYPKAPTLEFTQEPPPKTKIFHIENVSWILGIARQRADNFRVHSEIVNGLVGYDGTYVIRLMKHI